MPTAKTPHILSELPVVQRTPDFSLDQRTWPLMIYTLGRFGLVRDGVPIHFYGKVPRKPLELLKAIITCGGRGVSEEQLVGHL